MKLFVFLCVVLQLTVANSKKIPDLPQPCHRTDPNVQSCYLKMLNTLKYYIPIGIREYKIPPLDPLEIDVLRISEELSELYAVEIIAKKVKILGLSQVDITNYKLDIETLQIEMNATFPHIQSRAHFKFSGKMGGTPMELQGFVSANITDVRLFLTLQLEQIEKEGIKYFLLKTFNPKFFTKHAHLEITAKYPQDQSLADFITKSFNDNDRQLLELFNPVYTNVIKDAARTWLEEVYVEIPAERILVE